MYWRCTGGPAGMIQKVVDFINGVMHDECMNSIGLVTTQDIDIAFADVPLDETFQATYQLPKGQVTYTFQRVSYRTFRLLECNYLPTSWESLFEPMERSVDVQVVS